MRFLKHFISLIVLLLLVGCSGNKSDNTITNVQTDDDGEIFITDRTGKKWNITHAVRKYGFRPEQFEFGLGPFAILPIITPEHFSPGDPGFPTPGQNFLVIGADVEDERRAYPISVLKTFEIVDEVFAQTFVAVAY